MKWCKAFDNASSANNFKKIMQSHPDFYDCDLYKVDRSYRHFLEDKLIKYKMETPVKKP